MNDYNRFNLVCAPTNPGGGDDQNNPEQKSACQWLDEYVDFSRKWSPEAYDGFHEACGLFVLSTIARRQVGVVFGGIEFPSLYVALVGRTTLYAKSTTARIAISVLRAAGFGWLLAPDSSTPERLLQDMATKKLPRGYKHYGGESNREDFLSVLFSGQRGWFIEEFGSQLAEMMSRHGVMTKYRGLFRILHDNHPSYAAATISRGLDEVEDPYLAVLATMTPADLRPFAEKNSALWGDGFLARFALVSPPEDAVETNTFPEGKPEIPQSLVEPLQAWFKRLGLPDYEIDKDEDGLYVEVTNGTVCELEMSSDVRTAVHQYRKMMNELIAENDIEDLDGNHGRFPEKAIRIATLLASVSGEDTIQMIHWNRARQITERWRRDSYNLYHHLVTDSQGGSYLTDEEKVVRQIKKRGPVSSRTIQQNTGLLADEVQAVITKLTARTLRIFDDEGPERFEFISDESDEESSEEVDEGSEDESNA